MTCHCDDVPLFAAERVLPVERFVCVTATNISSQHETRLTVVCRFVTLELGEDHLVAVCESSTQNYLLRSDVLFLCLPAQRHSLLRAPIHHFWLLTCPTCGACSMARRKSLLSSLRRLPPKLAHVVRA